MLFPKLLSIPDAVMVFIRTESAGGLCQGMGSIQLFFRLSDLCFESRSISCIRRRNAAGKQAERSAERNGELFHKSLLYRLF